MLSKKRKEKDFSSLVLSPFFNISRFKIVHIDYEIIKFLQFVHKNIINYLPNHKSTNNKIEGLLSLGHITLNVNKFYIENRKRHIIQNIKNSLKRLILKNGDSILQYLFRNQTNNKRGIRQ